MAVLLIPVMVNIEMKLPDDFNKLQKLKAKLEKEEADRKTMIKLKEEVTLLLKKKENRKRQAKIEREIKIRKWLHLPRKTLIESGLFEDEEI